MDLMADLRLWPLSGDAVLPAILGSLLILHREKIILYSNCKKACFFATDIRVTPLNCCFSYPPVGGG